MPATAEQLKQIELFADLDRRELQSLANSLKERTYTAGETVVSEDKGGVGFFIIDEGARTATVTADTELRCYGLTSWAFRPLVEHNPSIAWKLLQTMAKRLRTTQQAQSQ